MAGGTRSDDGDVSGYHGIAGWSYDAWVVKLDEFGTLQWERCLGGLKSDLAYAILQTTDGGYIMAGHAGLDGGDVSGNHGVDDAWVVKLDEFGTLQWQKCLGGTSGDYARDIQQTMDGGYIIAGMTSSNNGDVSGNHGESDAWVVKLDGSGTLQWQKCLGGTGWDEAHSIRQTTDGGFIVAGHTTSNNGDVSGNHGVKDAWVVKLDGSGSLQWQKCLGGSGQEEALAIQQTADAGYIMAGWTWSNDGDVSGYQGGIYDAWVVKLNGTGAIQWQRCLGGGGSDQARAIQQVEDGGYVVAGFTDSNDGDVSGNHAEEDAWVVKLDGAGALLWQKCLGGTGWDEADAVQQTDDGGYIMAGHAGVNDGDVSGVHGDRTDAWVVKLGRDITTGNDELPFSSDLLIQDLTTGSLYLSWNGAHGPSTVRLLDASGRILETVRTKDNGHRLGLGSYRSGLYFVQVMFTDGTHVTKPVVKQ